MKKQQFRRFTSINAYLNAANCTVRTNMKDFFITKISEIGSTTVSQMTGFRKDFYQINLITNGDIGTYKINWKEYVQDTGSIYFISPDHIYSWVKHEHLDGYLLYFKRDLFNFTNTSFDLEFGELFSMEKRNKLSVNEQEKQNLEKLFNQLKLLYQYDTKLRQKIISSFLLSLLYILKHLHQIKHSSKKDTNTTYRYLYQFKDLIRQLYSEEKKVSNYASRLCVSPNHLNAICKQQTGKTAKALIEEHILGVAKTHLAYPNSTIGEISYQLGFDEPTNFIRFFKRLTKLTPQEFRNQNH